VVSSPFPNVPLRFLFLPSDFNSFLKVQSQRKGEISGLGEEKRMPRKYT
jgi:hypothetical protein